MKVFEFIKTVFLQLCMLIVFCGAIPGGVAGQVVHAPSVGIGIESVEADDFSDLEFLDSLVEGKSMVFLGESQHGVNDFNLVKFRLIRYLHQRHGFDVVVFESGVARCGLTNLIKDSLSGMRMLVHSLMGIWRVKGNCRMMDYFRENAIDIAGVDPNPGALYLYKDQLNLVLKNPGLSARLAETDSIYLYMFQIPKSATYAREKIYPEKYLDSVATCLANRYQLVEKEINELAHLTRYQKNIFSMALHANIQTLSVNNDPKSPRFFIANGERDQLMARNLEYIADSLYPGRKIIVWAHNAHITKTGNHKKWNKGASIPLYLQKERLKKSLVIGLFAVTGAYGLGMSSCYPIQCSRTSFENRYGALTTKGVYIPSHDLPDKKFSNGIPSRYPVYLKNMYDGMIILRDVGCSELMKYNKEFICE